MVDARSGGSTTFRVPLRFGTLARCQGDLSADPTVGDQVETLWVVDDVGLVLEVREADGFFDFHFRDWGSAPEVTAPPADQVEPELDFLLRGGI